MVDQGCCVRPRPVNTRRGEEHSGRDDADRHDEQRNGEQEARDQLGAEDR
jgi:hypothetical protein